MVTRVFYLDRPCEEAMSILKEVAEVYPYSVAQHCLNLLQNDIIWTGFTPVLFPFNIVASPCTGISHITAKEVIYLDSMWKLTQGRAVTSTAEYTFNLILQLAKKNKMQLYGKKLGIIGYGRIGSLVARYGRAFNMHPIIFETLDIRDKCPFEQTTLNRVIRESDVVSIHLPLDEVTKGFIGDKELYEMKDGVILINTSRPEIIDEFALQTFFKKLGGFGDDFIEYHMKFDTDKLFLFSNAISSPHIGGNCTEARIATDVYIANKVKDYILDTEKE